MIRLRVMKIRSIQSAICLWKPSALTPNTKCLTCHLRRWWTGRLYLPLLLGCHPQGRRQALVSCSSTSSSPPWQGCCLSPPRLFSQKGKDGLYFFSQIMGEQRFLPENVLGRDNLMCIWIQSRLFSNFVFYFGPCASKILRIVSPKLNFHVMTHLVTPNWLAWHDATVTPFIMVWQYPRHQVRPCQHGEDRSVDPIGHARAIGVTQSRRNVWRDPGAFLVWPAASRDLAI